MWCVVVIWRKESEVDDHPLSAYRDLSGTMGFLGVMGLVLFSASLSSSFAVPGHGKCEQIHLELCQDIGYNLTSMPNLIDHETQEDAAVSLETFRPLIKIGCSSKLRIFLCAVHAPMCTEKVETPIGPCRNLCNSVRDKCLPVLEQFGYTWPVALNCSAFPPANNDVHMCMEGPDTTDGSNNVLDDFVDEEPVPTQTTRVVEPEKPRGCDGFRHPKSFVFVERPGKCAQICEAPIAFAPEDRNFAEV
ncbi:unnamed protein product, partial [Notodromas monacha]